MKGVGKPCPQACSVGVSESNEAVERGVSGGEAERQVGRNGEL